MADVEFGRFDALTFDCYGTLIDWEAGISAGLAGLVSAHGLAPDSEELLERFAGHEAALEAGPYRRYREILAEASRRVGRDYGLELADDEVGVFAGSVGEWPAFADTAAALARLKSRYRLGVITNCDDDLFALSNRRLGVTFDWIVTAEQAGELQAQSPELRAGLRADRPTARANPSCCPEPLPRPRSGEGARSDDRLDRSPAGPPGVRRHAAGRGDARPRPARHGLTREGGCSGLSAEAHANTGGSHPEMLTAWARAAAVPRNARETSIS